MDCNNCNLCCGRNDEELLLSFFELPELYSIKPFSFKQVGPIALMKLPCVFFDAERFQCTIYEQRPLVCRSFPLKAVNDENDVFFFLHGNCRYYNRSLENESITSLLSNEEIHSSMSARALGEASLIFVHQYHLTTTKQSEAYFNWGLSDESGEPQRLAGFRIAMMDYFSAYILPLLEEMKEKADSFKEKWVEFEALCIKNAEKIIE